MNSKVLAVCLTSALCAGLQAQGLQVVEQDGTTTLSLPGGAPFHTTVAGVEDVRRVDVGGSSVVLALWNEVASAGDPTPYYAISLDGRSVDVVTRTSYRLRFEHGAFDPLAEEPRPVDPLLRAPASGNVYVVQFVTQPLEVYRRGLEDLGAKLTAYVADHGFAVEMDAGTRALVEELPYVRWVGPYHRAYRLERFVRANLGASSYLRPEAAYNVMLFEKGAARKAAVAARITALGGIIQHPDSGALLLEAVLTPEQVVQVAGFDEVQFIDRWGPAESDMNIALQFSGGLGWQSMGMLGTGVRGEVMDTSILQNHTDFVPPPMIHGIPASGGSHGTSTYGIVFGQGIACQTGVMPEAVGHYADEDTLNSVSRAVHTAELVDPAGPWRAVFQSNSWGSPRTLNYTTTSADMDQLLFDNDILIFQSQSNAGTRNSRPQAWAKNIMAVGGVDHFNTLSDADDQWRFASIGPASDGRIKPDLAHFYDSIATTTSGGVNSCTSSFGGTSGATPITAGHTGMIYELWHTGVLGNTPGPTVFDSRPHFTLVKALAIATARQWQFSGATANLTRVHQGWGRVDLSKLFDTIGNLFWVNETDVLANLEDATYLIDVTAGTPELHATLTWADLPGNPAVQSQHRVNDLTMRVTSPSGVNYFGNNGLDASMFSTPGGEANRIDTVENVIVQDPEPGTWTIIVRAQEINMDGHVETPAVDADFALVVAGGVASVPCAPAQSVSRNAGTNPVSYTAGTAALGGVLSATVDLTTTGHDQALLFAFDTQTTIPLSGGQTLLAIDGGTGEAFGLAPVNGPTAMFSVPIRNDITLCGMSFASQAIHLGGIVPFALSNAMDLTIGN